MSLKGQREEGVPEPAERTRVREQEGVLYRKGPLSEVEISGDDTGEKYAYYILPLCTSLWAPGGAKPTGSQWARKPIDTVHIGHLSRA